MPGRLVHIPVWWVIVGVMTCVLTPILTITTSAAIAKNTIKQNEEARREAASEMRIRYCQLIGSQIDVYSEAETPVGRNAYRTWLTEYQTQGCQPPR